MELNPAQARAVAHRGSPLLVLAGAGTGKTRVITHRIAGLIREGVPPWRILAVTFTNKAARELEGRLVALCGVDVRRAGMWVGTFHACATRIVREHGGLLGIARDFSIYDADDQRALMSRILNDLGVSTQQVTPGWILHEIERATHQGKSRAEWLAERTIADGDVLARAWREYEQRKRRAQALDFGDLLTFALALLERGAAASRRAASTNPGPTRLVRRLDPRPLAEAPADPRPTPDEPEALERLVRLGRRFAHVLVDEYQDTDPVQARLVERLAAGAELCVVGDDDQAIYGWRGADVGQILGFSARNPGCEVIRLEQNYRSTGHILACADAIISQSLRRLGKSLFSELGDGARVVVRRLDDERHEARFVGEQLARAIVHGELDPDECAVFYRTHAQARPLEETLVRLGIDYRVVGGLRFYDRKEVKDVLAYLRVLARPESDLDLLRIINVPARGIGKTSLERLAGFAQAHGLGLSEALVRAAQAGLTTAAVRKLGEFTALLERLRAAAAELDLAELTELVLDQTGYRDAVAAGPEPEASARLEVIQELVASIREFVDERAADPPPAAPPDDPTGEPAAPTSDLTAYLERVALAHDPEGRDRRARVSLMTVHSAKGLEFERVYVTGLEEGVFPHARALDDPDAMDEERRLAYVAVTRAKRELILTWASTRTIWGQTRASTRSRFVAGLPRAAVADGPARPAPRPAARPPAPRAEPRWDADIVRDVPIELGRDDGFADEGSGVQLYVGMTVRHAQFGRGELLGWSGIGDGLKLRVRFGDQASKTILARFCELA